MILAGDVGGTKVHLALYDFTDGKLNHTRDERYPAKEYSGLEEIVKEFLGARQGDGGLLWRARAGARRPAAPDQPALDAGQPRAVGRPGIRARLSDQRSGGQRLRHRRAVGRTRSTR